MLQNNVGTYIQYTFLCPFFINESTSKKNYFQEANCENYLDPNSDQPFSFNIFFSNLGVQYIYIISIYTGADTGFCSGGDSKSPPLSFSGGRDRGGQILGQPIYFCNIKLKIGYF